MILKRLQRLLSKTTTALEHVPITWLSLPFTLSSTSLAIQALSTQITKPTTDAILTYSTVLSSCLAYTSLVALLTLCSLLVLRSIVYFRHIRQSLTVHAFVAHAFLVPASIHTQFSAIAPNQTLWTIATWTSGALALSALPLYLRSRALAPWHLLFVGVLVACSESTPLARSLPSTNASQILSTSFVLWGSAITPTLACCVSAAKESVRARRGAPEVLASVSYAALAIMALGVECRRVWAGRAGPATAPLLLGEMAMGIGAVLGLLLWAAAAAWAVAMHFIVREASLSAAIGICAFARASVYVADIWDSTSALGVAIAGVAYACVVLLWCACRQTIRRETAGLTNTAHTMYGAV